MEKKAWQKQIEDQFENPPIAPLWGIQGSADVPFCTDEKCPAYDGKRCSIIGFQPGNICEPAVIEMAKELEKR